MEPQYLWTTFLSKNSNYYADTVADADAEAEEDDSDEEENAESATWSSSLLVVPLSPAGSAFVTVQIKQCNQNMSWPNTQKKPLFNCDAYIFQSSVK